jgi:hypothetical protein
MTQGEAQAECDRLASEHPDRLTHSWLPRQDATGEWTVAKVGVPRPRAGGTTQEARPRPPSADDPRPAFWRDAGGPWVGPG